MIKLKGFSGVTLLILINILLSTSLQAADRYWVGALNNNWNEIANWSASSGGVGGASVPGSLDRAIFNASGNVDCTLDLAPTIESIDIETGYTSIIDLNGNNLMVNGATNNDFDGGTFNNTTGGIISVVCTGTTYFRGTVFNPQITIRSERFYTNGSTFNADADFTKTGASSDASLGGNDYNANLILTNVGTGYILTGNSTPDSVTGNLTLRDSAAHHIYFAYNSGNNHVGGNVSIIHVGTGASSLVSLADRGSASLNVDGNLTISMIGTTTSGNVYIGNQGDVDVAGTSDATLNMASGSGTIQFGVGSSSTVNLTGNVTLNNLSLGSTNSRYTFGSNGDINLTNNLTITSSSTATNHTNIVANGTNSAVVIGGTLTATLSGSGTTGENYFGYNGDITVSGNITVNSSEGSTSSYVRFNHGTASTGTYNGNIVITNSNASGDGFYFGGSGGPGTLAAGRTVTIGGAGFIAGYLQFRNFTQTGTTAQNLSLTGTALFYNYDSDWGGNVNFSAPRLFTRGTLYRGTADLTKTGANDDSSVGGNIFDGVTTINNYGTEYLLLGNGGVPDTFRTHLTLNNTASDQLYLAYNSAGNYIGGNLTMTSNGIAGNCRIDVSTNTNSTTRIEGNVTASVIGSGTLSSIILGNNGDVDLVGNFDLINSSSANSNQCYLANGTNSSVQIGGNFTGTFTNSGANGQQYFGNNGDLTIGGNLTLTNTATATQSEVYINNSTPSAGSVGGNIVLVSNSATSEGFYFGQSGGSTVLAATRTITVGGGGFTSGNLRLRNFTQTGATPQTITTTGGGYIYVQDSEWGDVTSFTADRILAAGSTFGGNCTLTKTGAVDDRSNGGNVVNGNLTMNNTGSGLFQFGYNSPDSVNGNLTLNNSGTSNIHYAMRFPGHYVSGNVLVNNNGTGSGNVIYFGEASTATFQVDGDFTFNNLGAATANTGYISNNSDMTIGGNMVLNNNPTGARGHIYLANGVPSSTSVGGTTIVTSAGGGTHRYIYLGNYGDVTFTGDVAINHTATATNSFVYLNNYDSSDNIYNGNIVLNSSGNADAILFGNSAGSATLAAGRTISVGGGGYSSGYLRLRDFRQLGGTAQNLTIPSGQIDIRESDFSGAITFSGARMLVRESVFRAVTSLTKTGAGDDASYGGNRFLANTTLTNIGTGYFGMGNSAADSFALDLTMNNNSSHNMYLALQQTGHYVGGNLIATNNSTTNSDNIYLSNSTNAELTIAGNATLTNSPNGTGEVYLGNSGDVTVNGNLTATNSPIGSIGRIRLAYGTNSAVQINGNTVMSNSGSGNTSQLYLGYSGDVVFNGTVSILNSSSANSSLVYVADRAASSVLFNNNVVIESSHASCDGIYFGNSTGTTTLAATRTISVGGGGFIGGSLMLRNFTQIGPTPQTLTNSFNNGYIYSYNSDWGGDIIFTGGRMLTRGSRYRGTATLTKTGITDDASAGGNVFMGNTILNNSGSRYFGMGSGTRDSFLLDLTLNNTGTYYMYLGLNSADNYIGGNLIANNSGSGVNNNIQISNNSATSYTIDGTVTLNNNSSANSGRIYFGEQGDVTVGNNVTINQATTGTNGYTYIASSTSSQVQVNGNITATNTSIGNGYLYIGNSGDVDLNGNLSITNDGTGSTSTSAIGYGSNSEMDISGTTMFINSSTAASSSRCYLGYSGDVTFQSDLAVLNSSSSSNSHVYLNDRNTSVNNYNGNIVVSSSHANCDGVWFGNGSGNGVLAATRTLSVDGSGFIAGQLYLRNFTQTGTTPQSLITTGTSIIQMYNSNWGGDFVSESPRFTTRETTYSGTTSITKTGATDDASHGGNTFTGNSIITNNGSGYLRFANGLPDVWSANLTLNNNGSRHIYIAYNSPGNSIAGNLISNNNGTGSSYVYGAVGSASSLAVGGNVTLTNSGIGANVRTYFPESGDVTVGGNLTSTNSVSGASGYVYMATGTNSSLIVGGNTSINNSGAGTSKHSYLGENGDVTCNGTLNISNSSTANNSHVYCNRGSASQNEYYGNITMEVTDPACDGIWFGQGNGVATLAAGMNLNIGGGGFVGGNLYFRNFTQLGSTASSLPLTGNTRYYTYNSSFGGALTVSTGRYYGRTTTYSNNFSLTYNSTSNSDSYGGNTFNADVSYTKAGASTLRLAYSAANDYNGDVTIAQTAGNIQPAYRHPSTFAGDINVDCASAITMAASSGTVVLDGNTDQEFNDVGTTSNFRIRRLTVNKSGGRFVLNEPLRIQTTATLTSGIIDATSVNSLIFEDESTVTAANNSSFVDGEVDKIGNNAFTFPVGDGSVYRPISISAPNSNSSRFQARYHEVDPSTLYGWGDASWETPLERTSTREYWVLDRIATAANVVVTLSWSTNSGGVTDLSTLAVCRHDGSIWRHHGNGGTTGNTTEGTVSSSGAISSFSPFTLGSTSITNNPLPVELEKFEAKENVQENVVDLFWVTSSEINNDYFKVEKTTDLHEFEEVVTVDGQGTTNERTEYHEKDYNPAQGVSYYRLSQTDFDGTTTYFDLEKVKFDLLNSDKELDIQLYPNPNNGHNMFMKIPNSGSEELSVLVNDFLGKDFLVDFTVINEGEYSIVAIEMTDKLAAGSYMVNVKVGDRVHTHKLIVQ